MGSVIWTECLSGKRRSQTADDDYFIIIVRRRRMWSWEIQRRSKPLGLRFDGEDFDTPSAAKRAGEEALKAFLDALRIEQISRQTEL